MAPYFEENVPSRSRCACDIGAPRPAVRSPPRRVRPAPTLVTVATETDKFGKRSVRLLALFFVLPTHATSLLSSATCYIRFCAFCNFSNILVISWSSTIFHNFVWIIHHFERLMCFRTVFCTFYVFLRLFHEKLYKTAGHQSSEAPNWTAGSGQDA